MPEYIKFLGYITRARLFIIDVLFPRECIWCGWPGEWLCQGCLNGIKHNLVDECVVCRQESRTGITHAKCQPGGYLDGVIVAGRSDDKLLHDLIYKFKYNFVRDLSRPLAQVLADKILILKQSGLEVVLGSVTVVPIPLHRRRLRWRGFNQAGLLAKEVADIFGWMVGDGLIIRRKYTKPQMKLRKRRRKRNIRGAFEVVRDCGIDWDLDGHIVLLVDDVLTSGATMQECARILKASGVKRIWGLVLSRG